MATTNQAAGQPAFGRPVRNPLSLLRVDAAMARLAAVIGVAFFLQSIPLLMGQLGNMAPAWTVSIVALLVASLVACVIAAIFKRMVRATYVTFAAVYLIALVSWPFAVLSEADAPTDSYWLYFLLTIATTMASVSLEIPIAVVYTVGAPILYGIIRITPPGGGTRVEAAVLDSVYSMLLGGGILIMIAVLRTAASGVDTAQQNALERYSHAVRQHATEAERVQVDSIVHDSVLTTLLSAARSFSPEAKTLAATMAGNAIGHLREAVAVAPDSEATVWGEVVAQRIATAAESMSEPVAVTMVAEEWCDIPVHVAEAAYSASVQAMINSLQHAGPGVDRWVDIRSHGHQAFTIEIGDRGAGFDPQLIPTERLGVRVSIIERVASAGGHARIDTAPGEGTVVTLTWDPPGETADREPAADDLEEAR
ncbi:ATP-binding protein [Pseudolysinimonas sp.]|uniref:sensor histidine kinase n=1 Tax=Pseudolysinimonas sp. TaxID=2680009 RepID=UPI00286B6C3D|nr:ATP-binding protein [Pseudolysinimonas sp.]